jgi:anti-sigma factor RsiW
MTAEGCADIVFLLQADIDGELDIGGTARLAAHLARCPDCAAEQVAMAGLSARLRAGLPHHAAPARLREAIAAAVAASANATLPGPTPVPSREMTARRPWSRLAGRWRDHMLSFGSGAALAAALAMAVVLPRGGDMQASAMESSVIESHIRALQPGHLMDVVSTDQHTVKPWFDGRLDFAPAVKDLRAEGFPLLGGRLDYLAGRAVAALAYGRAKHIIDLYVWPGSDARPERGNHDGYNYLRWTQDDMVFWAVSDLNPAELGAFAAEWREAK